MQGGDELKDRKPGEKWGVIDFSDPDRSDPPLTEEQKELVKRVQRRTRGSKR